MRKYTRSPRRGQPLTINEALSRLGGRARLEAVVAEALDLLDQADGDPDLEPECEDEGADTSDMEPSLGAPENHHDQTLWAPCTAIYGEDAELDFEGAVIDHDADSPERRQSRADARVAAMSLLQARRIAANPNLRRGENIVLLRFSGSSA